jgi:hypothetical protein
LWPVFRVADLRQRGVAWSGIDDRSQAVEVYLAAGATAFAPSCFRAHKEAPLDWGHTLAALYRVRCNLFHGEKAGHSENDRVMVGAALSTLLAFVDEGKLLRSSRSG